jgi:hypothetical protein
MIKYENIDLNKANILREKKGKIVLYRDLSLMVKAARNFKER